MKLLALAAATTLFATITGSGADKIDVSAMTCSQFTQSDEAKINLILTWFMGFYSDVQNPQVIDVGRLDSTRRDFMAFCTQEPAFRLTTAAEGLLGK